MLFLKIVSNIILLKNHCQLNLKATKMALGETGKVDFGRTDHARSMYPVF